MPATKVWNRDFFILWQGQLVSFLGDVVYSIGLGFWILQTTGSTALMGALLAASAIPRVFAAPFAGVIVDRADRKWLMIAMDVLRAVAVLLVALAAFSQRLRTWMVFGAGVTIGLGGAVFSPSVSSILPDIVPRDRLVQANASYSLISTGSGVVGNSAGGFVFQLFGAPVLFLVNGLSYLVSSVTLFFIRVPRHPKLEKRPGFREDLVSGIRAIRRLRGLRDTFVAIGALNFFGVMGMVLILPLFQRTAGLGPARYGLAMASLTGGMFAGFILSSIVRVRPAARFGRFAVFAYLNGVCLTLFPQLGGLGGMVPVLFLAGLGNAVLNSFIMACIQMSVPRDMIGKVSALLMTLSGGLVPLAMAAAGVLAEFLPLRPLMSACYAAMMIIFTPMMFNREFRDFINIDPASAAGIAAVP
jgi:DHA3 family macrolide efflux protein-like MFS transporter